jgi:hypothetical protein
MRASMPWKIKKKSLSLPLKFTLIVQSDVFCKIHFNNLLKKRLYKSYSIAHVVAGLNPIKQCRIH